MSQSETLYGAKKRVCQQASFRCFDLDYKSACSILSSSFAIVAWGVRIPQYQKEEDYEK